MSTRLWRYPVVLRFTAHFFFRFSLSRLRYRISNNLALFLHLFSSSWFFAHHAILSLHSSPLLVFFFGFGLHNTSESESGV